MLVRSGFLLWDLGKDLGVLDVWFRGGAGVTGGSLGVPAASPGWGTPASLWKGQGREVGTGG